MRRFILFCLLTIIFHPAVAQITISPEHAERIGQKIWQNEGAGKPSNLTVWNKNEDFPSFGIGHFIWYPAGVEETFTESFPQLLVHISQTRPLPNWLTIQDAPWPNREAFYQEIDSARMRELRQFLQTTIPEQVAFIVKRMEGALPQILNHLESPAQRKKIESLFYKVAQQPNGIYALIDYINFKGEGISIKERYNGYGWGLLQVHTRCKQ